MAFIIPSSLPIVQIFHTNPSSHVDFPAILMHDTVLKINYEVVPTTAHLTFDGSEFFIRKPTFSIQFSHLHQQLPLVRLTILTTAIPCPDLND
jgi:hypothetical protein